MSDAVFKALVRELKELKRSHDAMGDKIAALEERIEAAATPEPPAEVTPVKGKPGEKFLGLE